MVVITAKQAALWDKSMKGLDNMRTFRVCKEMPFIKEGKILTLDGLEMVIGKRLCLWKKQEIDEMVAGGWLEEFKESLLSKVMNNRYFLSESRARNFIEIANEHYEKEVMEALVRVLDQHLFGCVDTAKANIINSMGKVFKDKA